MNDYAGLVPSPGSFEKLNAALNGRKGRRDVITTGTDLIRTTTMLRDSLVSTRLRKNGLQRTVRHMRVVCTRGCGSSEGAAERLQECEDCRTLTQVKRTSCAGCVRPAAQRCTANAVSVSNLSMESMPLMPFFGHSRTSAGLRTESHTVASSSRPQAPRDAASHMCGTERSAS